MRLCIRKRDITSESNNVSKYRHYLGLLTRQEGDGGFSEFHLSVNNKIGYEVSPFRAIELIMYLNAPTY